MPRPSAKKVPEAAKKAMQAHRTPSPYEANNPQVLALLAALLL
jgi:hypothetical protein